ncbi:MAG: hypothetical protein DMG70_31095 [Acidobacteria bacterium]|nr:MAG: hypothetical protein DMG70_31095 [Acidobacteriota bacterium]PYY12333.1 MAG: hypothetical protein DMG69_01455 [Acidobacteriota bacterium]
MTWALSISVPADLAAPGFTVLLPRTEHAPFDLVAYASGKFYRCGTDRRTPVRSTWVFDRCGMSGREPTIAQ